jgi:electron transfer flavoprotein alpha subunit
LSETQSSNELWAILQHDGATLEEYSGELLSQLVELAQRRPGVASACAVLLTAPGAPLPDLAPLGLSGIPRLYVVGHPLLTHYRTEAWVSALAWMIHAREPLLVATSGTANGRDWMPRLAARLRLPYAPGCLSIDLQDDALLALRPIYEGRAYVQTRTTLNGRTALATLLTGVRGNPAPGERVHEQPSLAITRFEAVIDTADISGRVQHLETQSPSPEEVELEAAERIIAGGRGIGLEGFAYIAEFARQLGAAVGATRVATDRGWVEHARQIGATGKSVHPKLYIACGISGAAQHTSGMHEAQTVIAINPDRTAPIFALADLGLLGDANLVLPLAAGMISQQP